MSDYSNVKWNLLVQALTKATSKNFVAVKLNVQPKEVSRWIFNQKNNAPSIPRADKRLELIQLAEQLNVPWKNFAELCPSFEFGRSFQSNKLKGPMFLSAIPQDLPVIPTRILGYDLTSPIGLSASPLTVDSSWISPYAARGYDIITYNTVRSSAMEAHPAPNVLYIENLDRPLAVSDPQQKLFASLDPPNIDIRNISLAFSHGMPSSGPEEWIDDVRSTLGLLKTGQLLIVSVIGTARDGGTILDDFVHCARMAYETGAHAVELNFGCRIQIDDARRTVSRNLSLATAICRAVRNHLPTAKLLIKLDLLSAEELRDIFEVTYEFVDGYTAITGVPIDVQARGQHGADPAFATERRTRPNVAGAAVRELVLAMIKQLHFLREKKPNLEIIGVGGIAETQDAMALLEAGANAVQCCTAAIHNSNLAAEVRRGLAAKQRSAASSGASDKFHFTDKIVEEAYKLAAEVSKEMGLGAEVGFSVLHANWLEPYRLNERRLEQTGIASIRTRRAIPQKHQLREWILREQKKRK